MTVTRSIKRLDNEFTRFVLFGGVNTVLTYILYAVLLFIVSYSIAYTLSYAAGIGLAYYLNSRFVFKSEMQVGKALQFPLVYAVQYLMGLVLLSFLVELLKIDALIAQPLVILMSIPVTFTLSRLILKGRPGADQR